MDSLTDSQPSSTEPATREMWDDTAISVMRSYHRNLAAWANDEHTPAVLRDDLDRFLSWMPYMIIALAEYGRSNLKK